MGKMGKVGKTVFFPFFPSYIFSKNLPNTLTPFRNCSTDIFSLGACSPSSGKPMPLKITGAPF